mgnify:CR=1 FL=1
MTMENKKNVPEIRFKGFTKEWVKCDLRDVSTIKTGYPFNSSDFDGNGIYKVITNGNIQDNSAFVDNSTGNKINILDKQIIKDYVLNIGDILVTMDGTVGRTAKVNNLYQVLAQRVGRLIANRSAEFLYQYLNTGEFHSLMTTVSVGGTIKHISLSDIGDFQIIKPTNDSEEYKIGAFLEKLDDLKALTEQKLKKLKTIKKACLEKMFPHNGSNTPEIRFKGFTEEWIKKHFGEFGSVSMNKRIFKYQTDSDGEIPFYKIGTFGGEPDSYISRELFEEYKIKYPYPQIGDILISASGSIGRTVEYKGADEYFQDSNIVWLAHDERLSNLFLKHLYSIIKWSGLEGSTIKRLYNKNILDTTFMLPNPEYKEKSIEEQIQIGNYFQNIDKLIFQTEQKIEKLKNIKKACLDKMFVNTED